jgi:hypothetical protein
MKKFSFFFVATYLTRSVIFFGFGDYTFVPAFWKYECFYLLSSLFELPNLIFVYYTHYT